MRTREMLIPNAFASPFPRFCRMHVSGVRARSSPRAVARTKPTGASWVEERGRASEIRMRVDREEPDSSIRTHEI